MMTPKTEFKTSDPRDWPEDFPHENGIYFCGCRLCGERFTGHKRRVLCKVCHTNELRLERDKAIADLDAARAELAEVRRRTAQSCAQIALRRAAYLEGRQKSLEDEGMPEMAHDAWAGAVGANLVADDISGEFLAEQPPVSPPAHDAGERHGKGKL